MLRRTILLFCCVKIACSTSYCNLISPPVPLCENEEPRDLLFLVDGSDSMDPARFYAEMLDYTEALYCAFDPRKANQAGMVVFNQEITTYIPLATYSQQEWFGRVESLRANPLACCSCCTPTAEAFDRAREVFLHSGKNKIKIAFMITDGVPSNNFRDTGGNPEWWYPPFNPAQYNAEIVAQEANLLKAIPNGGARVFLVGVPNRDGVPPKKDFFQGTGFFRNSPVKFELERQGIKYSYQYRKPPNPIVSVPIEDNSFSSNTWNVQALITQTVQALCRVEATLPPTNQPTQMPTSEPSQTPTSSFPTQVPTTSLPTLTPTASPVTPFLDQVDVTFLLDRSNSMNWRQAFCANVINTLPRVFPRALVQPSPSACWEIFMRYVLDQADAIANIPTAGVHKNRRLGWANEFSVSGKGLRVQVVGFACDHHQKTPLMFDYSDNFTGGVAITSRNQLFNLLEHLRSQVLPFGGTCPALSIEQSVKYVERSSVDLFPYQSVILVTDGVFFDVPNPQRATRGLEAYKVVRFSVGIAVFAEGGTRYGMTGKEIKTQQEQLRAFAGVASNFKNLGVDGWQLLFEIALEIASDIPHFVGDNQPIPRYTWCGWRRIFNCQSDNWRLEHCQWVNTGQLQYGCSSV